MAATTLTPVHRSTDARAREIVNAIRFAPAPRWEGPASKRSRYVAYLLGSMLAWTAAGLGIAAALGGLTGLAG